MKKNNYNYHRITKVVHGKRKSFYGKTKKEAERKLKEYLDNHIASNTTISDTCFGEALAKWLYEVKRFDAVKPSTIDRYDIIYRNHIHGTELAAKKICMIKSHDLQLHINEMVKHGSTADNIKNVFKVIKMFVKYLVAEEAMEKDITVNVNIPKKLAIQSKIHIFSENQRRIVSARITEFRYPFIIQLGFASGLRLGEILSLKYDDFKDEGVYVNKTLTCSNIVISSTKRERIKQIVPPKSKSSIRFVPLPATMNIKLLEHKALHNEMLLKYGGTYTGYCFTKQNGEFLDLNTISGNIRKFFKNCGFNHSAHDMRHTYITNLIISGVPLPIVKELAGHSDIQMTMKYISIERENKIKAIAQAESSLIL